MQHHQEELRHRIGQRKRRGTTLHGIVRRHGHAADSAPIGQHRGAVHEVVDVEAVLVESRSAPGDSKRHEVPREQQAVLHADLVGEEVPELDNRGDEDQVVEQLQP